MNEALNLAGEGIDREYSEESASTRRKFVAGAGATIGGMGLLGMGLNTGTAFAAKNDVQTILNVAATAEVLATIVNTVGPEKIALDQTTKNNIESAARQELIHYETLVSVGGEALTKQIWVPNAVLGSKKGLLEALVFGDQIFINAYLIATTEFAKAGEQKLARYTGEFMGVEAVHRALALQSLGFVGNDRAFMRYAFPNIEKAVERLQSKGFGFGAEGSAPGEFYDYDVVSQRTPDPRFVNTKAPS